jgi:hypothetical protein
MFEQALAELEAGNNRVTAAHNAERAASQRHKSCRAQEEIECDKKRECDYDLYRIWTRFVEEESTLRQLSLDIDHHFCEPEANGTLWIFRDISVALFPPWIEQKPIVETWEEHYHDKVPVCERQFGVLDDKTAECDAIQLQLERAACSHGNVVAEVRNLFAESWAYAMYTYQRILDEVHCLEIDRWKEWRTLASVQCLLDRTSVRNGRPCDESTDEVVTEVARCEEIQVTESIDHLRIIYHEIPAYPDPCPTPPWEVVPAVYPYPGRCVPVPPQVPCSGGYIGQEYAELWTPPQPEFHSEHSHCNQRPECEACEQVQPLTVCMSVYGHTGPWIIYPQPEHECSTATRNQLAIGEFDANGDGHWTPSYMRMDYGAANCPEGKKITTYAECEAAHVALGFEINPVWTGNYGSIPGYCSTRELDQLGGHHFHFNSLAVGVVRADLAPVCRA